MKRCFCLIISGMVGLSALIAQVTDSRRSVAVHGEITSDGATPVSLTVELDGNGSGPVSMTSVSADGTFDFRSVSPGVHELRVVGPGGAVLHQENVVINGPYQRISINLPASQQP